MIARENNILRVWQSAWLPDSISYGGVEMPDWKTETRKLDALKQEKQKVKEPKKPAPKRKGTKKNIGTRRDILDCMKAPKYERRNGAIRQR